MYTFQVEILASTVIKMSKLNVNLEVTQQAIRNVMVHNQTVGRNSMYLELQAKGKKNTRIDFYSEIDAALRTCFGGIKMKLRSKNEKESSKECYICY